jgi:hypothetical protein
MQRTLTVRRTSQARVDGQQRWDRAYQLALRAAPVEVPDIDPAPTAAGPPNQEAYDEDRNLCACLDQPAGTGAVH